MKKIIYIYGPQGSGKSTLLKQILALRDSDESFSHCDSGYKNKEHDLKRLLLFESKLLIVEDYKFHLSDFDVISKLGKDSPQIIFTSCYAPPKEIEHFIIKARTI